MRGWILVLSLYTAGWLALMGLFLRDNFDRSLRWVGSWAGIGWVVLAGGVVGPALAITVLLAGPTSSRTGESADRARRRARIFLVSTLLSGLALPLSHTFGAGSFAGAAAIGWVVLVAPWVALHHRWFVGDGRGEF